MKTQLSTLDISVHITATEKEARILNLVAGYLRSDGFAEHFTKTLPAGVTPEQFDAAMNHLHGHLGAVLRALDEGREKIATDLRALSR